MPTDFEYVSERSIVDVLGLSCIQDLIGRFERIIRLAVSIESGNGEKVLAASGNMLIEDRVSVFGCLPFVVRLHQTPSPPLHFASNDLQDALQIIIDQLVLRIHQAAPASSDIESPLRLKDILECSPTPMGWSDITTGKIEYLNKAFIRLFGYKHDEIQTLDAWFTRAFPDPGYREKVIHPWQEKAFKGRHKHNTIDSVEVEVVCKNGSLRRALLSATWVGNRRIVNYSDMTDYWRAQSRLSAQNQMLEMVATGKPLTEAIEHIVRQVETESKEALCSVLLLDEDNRLRNCAAPSLPESYLNVIDGLKIGPATGSCGPAAFHRRRVVVENIAEHEYWKNYTELAKKTGIAACWSEPIIASNGDVLGTFAMYYPHPARPKKTDIDLIVFASHLASIAIEIHRGREVLETRANFDDLTGLANRGHFFEYADQLLWAREPLHSVYSMAMIDLDHFKQINDQYGHKVGDQVLREVAKTMSNVVTSDCIIGRIGGEEFGIMFANTTLEQAFEFSQRLCQAVAQLTLHCDADKPIQVTISIGVAQSETDADDSIDRLFGRADEALYTAKKSGRNRVVKYTGTS